MYKIKVTKSLDGWWLFIDPLKNMRGESLASQHAAINLGPHGQTTIVDIVLRAIEGIDFYASDDHEDASND